MLNKIFGKKEDEQVPDSSPSGSRKQENKQYAMGKHTDIVPSGYMAGESFWMEQKSLSSDPELHNLRNMTRHPNTITIEQDIKQIDAKEHNAPPEPVVGAMH